MSKGITTSEVIEKLKIFGYNEMPSSKPKNVGQIALEVMLDPGLTVMRLVGLPI